MISSGAGYGIDADASGNTYSIGINSDGEVIAVKYDISGNSVWTLTIGQPGDDYSYGTGIAFEPSSGDAFVVGLIGAFTNPINFGSCNSLTINTNALEMFIKQICDADLPTASFKVGNNNTSNALYHYSV